MTVTLIEELKKVKLSYIVGVDQGNIDLLKTVFADKVDVDVSESLFDPDTNTAYMHIPAMYQCDGSLLAVSMSQLSTTAKTKHTVGEPSVTLIDDTTVHAAWPMTDIVEYFDPNPFSKFEGTGYYHETYTKENNSWKISSIRLERTKLTIY